VTTTLRITVDDMSYRDLFQFADLARASHIDPSTKVDWGQSYRIVIGYLNSVGLRGKDPFACPLVAQRRAL
jgi:hypothetical protein